MRRDAPSFWKALFSWFTARSERVSALGRIGCLAFLGLTAVYGLHLGGHLDRSYGRLLAHADVLALKAGFEIEHVVVEGHAHLPRSAIDAALGQRRGVSLLAYDTAAAQARLEAIGWVRRATVMRLWPRTLAVEIEERAPSALWRREGALMAVDAEGVVLGPAQAGDYQDLPRIAGAGAAEAAGALMQDRAAAGALGLAIVEAERVSGRRWDVILEGGTRIRLPARAVREALLDAAAVIGHGTVRLAEIAALDLRVAGQMAVQLRDPSEQSRERFLSQFAKREGARDTKM